MNIGNIYTDLLGEFGRSLGAGVNLVSGLAGSGAARALNPISIGVDALNFELNSLISFLQVRLGELVGWDGSLQTLPVTGWAIVFDN